MFAVIGILGGILLLVAVIGIFYFAGNRGRRADSANQQQSAAGRQSEVPYTPTRTEGRGDL
ncbi:hypothetical protein [Terriglobus aquaticus]|uniref:Uncharacterized protein n=1 Tax=Terriglobus aquaticus TaxID=940139 RepID=A0ABW9KMK5_9BACT|nr:hypothetical protein [Terriglobus aquaticus]